MFREILPAKFGSMYTASFTLFQLITLDDWFELYDDIRVADAADRELAGSGAKHDGVHPVFLYFFVFIVTENFIFVNLFTAVIVNNLEIHQQKLSVPSPSDREAKVSARMLNQQTPTLSEGRD